MDSAFWKPFVQEGEDGFVVDGSVKELSPDDAYAHAKALSVAGLLTVKAAHTKSGHSVALALATALAASVLIEPMADGACVARIRIPSPVPHPEPLPEPSRPRRMHDDLPVVPPPALANDYAPLIAEARVGPMPSSPISVVIPVYNRKRMLRRTLACLTHQTYPLELIEVVVADDGSSDNPDTLLKEFDGYFGAIRYVRQDDEGYRLSEVRNLGLLTAGHEHMILLDCDMAPVPRMVELYARHLDAEPNAIYCGHRRYVDANDVTPRQVLENPESILGLSDIRPDNAQVTVEGEEGPTIDWRLPIYQETASLRFDAHPFRAVCGGNIGFTKTAFAETGVFDVDFRAWGGEDAEWGYRAWNKGIYIVPLLDACGLHQEPPGGRNETDREAGRKETHPLLVDKCPVRFRGKNAVGSHSVPLVSIYVPAYNAEDTIVGAVQSALDQTVTDLEVCIVDDGSTDNTAALVTEHFGANKRVRMQSQANAGIGAASEAAVRMCRAPFIGQLDADDLLEKTAVKLTLATLRSDQRIGVAYSSSELLDPRGKRCGPAYEFPHFSRYDLMYGMIVHHFRLFRSRDWYRTSGFATDIANAVDYDMYLKLAEVTEIVHLPERLYLYRKHATSTSYTRKRTQQANHRLVIGRAMDRRGLSNDWTLIQNVADDARKYEFVPRARTAGHFGAGLDTVRVRIRAGTQTKAVMENVRECYPGWKPRWKSIEGTAHIVTRQISHARAIRGVEQLQQTFPAIELEVVYP